MLPRLISRVRAVEAVRELPLHHTRRAKDLLYQHHLLEPLKELDTAQHFNIRELNPPRPIGIEDRRCEQRDVWQFVGEELLQLGYGGPRAANVRLH